VFDKFNYKLLHSYILKGSGQFNGCVLLDKDNTDCFLDRKVELPTKPFMDEYVKFKIEEK
jgi:hypothetical protein